MRVIYAKISAGRGASNDGAGAVHPDLEISVYYSL